MHGYGHDYVNHSSDLVSSMGDIFQSMFVSEQAYFDHWNNWYSVPDVRYQQMIDIYRKMYADLIDKPGGY